MPTLVEALERFNRKERNLLIRQIVTGGNFVLPLDGAFRKALGTAIGIEIPAGSQWWTDFHINWIAGALALHVQGSDARGPWQNRRTTPKESFTEKGGALIEGNQEDIDLVIAFDQNLVLVEVKADSAFGNEQLKSKLERINLVRDFHRSLAGADETRFIFALISPYEPQKLKLRWPEWALKNGRVPWLQLPLSKTLLEVGRCNEHGIRQVNPDYWAIFPTRELTE